MKREFPAGTGISTRVVEVDSALVPILLSLLTPALQRSVWATEEDWRQGYQALLSIIEGLIMPSQLVVALNRVYMALRQQSAGEVFVAGPGGTQPELPPVPPALPTSLAPGLLQLVYQQQGETPGGFLGIGSRPVTLADIYGAVRAGEPTELDNLLEHVDLLGDTSDITSIYNAVKGTATDLASLTEGGGTLATLIVASLAQVAAAGLAAGQMDTLLARQTDLLARLDSLVTLLSPD